MSPVRSAKVTDTFVATMASNGVITEPPHATQPAPTSPKVRDPALDFADLTELILINSVIAVA